jgi:hypothetical protein
LNQKQSSAIRTSSSLVFAGLMTAILPSSRSKLENNQIPELHMRSSALKCLPGLSNLFLPRKRNCAQKRWHPCLYLDRFVSGAGKTSTDQARGRSVDVNQNPGTLEVAFSSLASK